MKHHFLAATPDTVAFGTLAASRPPVLRIASGDEVTIEAIPAGDETQVPSDASRIMADQRLILDTAVRGAGPHPVTGPIHVEGAEIGDTLQVDILDVSLRQDWGYCCILPLLGTLPDDFPDAAMAIIDIDRERNLALPPWGGAVPLAPFFGVLSVAPPPAWGSLTTVIPREFGGNMDNKALRAGTTLYLPVFNPGALFSAGDGHAVQGDGEVCITALETAVSGRFRLTVRKDLQHARPFAETDQDLIAIGLGDTLDEAARQAIREMIAAIRARTELTASEAYMLCSLAGDLKVTQTVDVRKGVHMVLPKSVLPA